MQDAVGSCKFPIGEAIWKIKGVVRRARRFQAWGRGLPGPWTVGAPLIWGLASDEPGTAKWHGWLITIDGIYWYPPFSETSSCLICMIQCGKFWGTGNCGKKQVAVSRTSEWFFNPILIQKYNSYLNKKRYSNQWLSKQMFTVLVENNGYSNQLLFKPMVFHITGYSSQWLWSQSGLS